MVLTRCVPEQSPEHVARCPLRPVAKPHRDSGDEEIPNVILKVSSFEGGELWIEDPLVNVDRRKIAGVITVTPFQNNVIEFDAKTALRTTMPWTGTGC